jgi:hypothetical protein
MRPIEPIGVRISVKTIRKVDCACQTECLTTADVLQNPIIENAKTSHRNARLATLGSQEACPSRTDSSFVGLGTQDVRPAVDTGAPLPPPEDICLAPGHRKNMADVQRSMLCIAHQINQLDHEGHKVHHLKAKQRVDHNDR